MGHADEIGATGAIDALQARVPRMLQVSAALRGRTAHLLESNARLRAQNSAIRTALADGQLKPTGGLATET
jgi:regulator of replication initiation timing